MTVRRLALVVNFHRERRIGRKSANFVGAVHAHLRRRGIQLNVEFVLDRPDEATHRQIDQAAGAIDGARLHVVDFGNLGASRTHGVAAARGDVVCFLDGDDYFSMNWFEGALDHLSQGPRREVLHTQYMVGFDRDEFVRETMESADPAFDPLALAVDWYWSANLAVQAEVFAAVPIQPYDHAGGFGSEDWDWACNSLAAGIGRVSLPNTSYFYRVKPERFALGRVGEVIHMASPLFGRENLPPPPAAPSAGPLPVAPLSPLFFAQAREIEAMEVGLSYLRAVEAGGQSVRHFKPHTPPIVGAVLREVLDAGFGDGSAVIFADAQRLAGGLETAAALADTLVGSPAAPRLYIVDGDEGPRHARLDGYVLSLDELRAAKLYNAHIDRLVARLLIQARDVTVLNLLSPRARSPALAYWRATRKGVCRWVNVVMEYGFDALSQAYEELDLFASTSIASETIAVFEKTAREAWRTRGLALAHDQALEDDYVGGALGSRRIAPRLDATLNEPSSGAPVSPAQSRVFRITAQGFATAGPDEPRGGVLLVDDALRALAEREDECILVSGAAFLGMDFAPAGAARPPGLRIPALTIIDEEGQPVLYVRHRVDWFDQQLASGRFPMDLGATGALGVDCRSLREVLQRFPKRLPLAALIETAVRHAGQAGERCVDLFAANCIVSASAADLALIDKAALAAGLAERLDLGAPP
ncbi:MAG: glycosyltransferase [Caulobacteraceae bacterium]